MSAPVIWEHKHRGHLWRLEIATFRGRTFGNWRKWYRDGDEWKPTREGCTIPIAELSDLAASLMAFQGIKPPEG